MYGWVFCSGGFPVDKLRCAVNMWCLCVCCASTLLWSKGNRHLLYCKLWNTTVHIQHPLLVVYFWQLRFDNNETSTFIFMCCHPYSVGFFSCVTNDCITHERHANDPIHWVCVTQHTHSHVWYSKNEKWTRIAKQKNYAKSFSSIFMSLSFNGTTVKHTTHPTLLMRPTNEIFIWYGKVFISLENSWHSTQSLSSINNN